MSSGSILSNKSKPMDIPKPIDTTKYKLKKSPEIQNINSLFNQHEIENMFFKSADKNNSDTHKKSKSLEISPKTLKLKEYHSNIYEYAYKYKG